MSYDLRRLRLHGLIERIPKSQRYRRTDFGLKTALFYNRVHQRLLRRGLSEFLDPRTQDAPLPKAFSRFKQFLDDYIDEKLGRVRTCSVYSSFSLSRTLVGWNEGTHVGPVGEPASNGEATWNSRMHGVSAWTAGGAASDAATNSSASTTVGSMIPASYTWSAIGLAKSV